MLRAVLAAESSEDGIRTRHRLGERHTPRAARRPGRTPTAAASTGRPASLEKTRTNHSTRVRRRTWRKWPASVRTAAAIIGTASLVLLAAACGGSPSSAGSSTGSGGASTAGRTTSSQLLAFARCVRSHGVANYPDPNSSGKLPTATPQQLGVSSAQYQAAQNACQHLLPNGAGGPTPAQVQQQRNSLLPYARCMRTHGVPNFPDPDSRGHLDVGPGTDVPVNTPQFQRAFGACKHTLSYYQSP
jgi:hypothetical protein